MPFGDNRGLVAAPVDQGPFGRNVIKPIRGGGQKMNPPTQAMGYDSFMKNNLANEALPLKKRAFSKAPTLSKKDQKVLSMQGVVQQ